MSTRPPRKPATKAATRPSAAAARDPRATRNAGSRLIDERIRKTGGWRGEALARVRSLVLESDPGMTEEIKWVKPTNPLGVIAWSHDGLVCTGETYKDVVKVTFARGASLPDPSGLLNAGLKGGTRRAIDIREGEKVNARAFKALVKAAVAANGAMRPAKASKSGHVKLLSGGNPQIAKADGDAPVQAYIAAMPGWKRDVGRRLDAIIARTVPGVRKAVKWNSPFYGVEGRGWFMSIHVFTRYVKVTFFAGSSLKPVPPGPSKDKNTRYLDIYEDGFDETQVAAWVEQAAALPGWNT